MVETKFKGKQSEGLSRFYRANEKASSPFFSPWILVQAWPPQGADRVGAVTETSAGPWAGGPCFLVQAPLTGASGGPEVPTVTHHRKVQIKQSLKNEED